MVASMSLGDGLYGSKKIGRFYEINNFVTYDDELKDRITALSLYSKLW